MAAKTERTCPICSIKFQVAGKRKFCGKKCAEVRQLQQIAENLKKRRLVQPKRKTACVICGNKGFKPKHSRHLYCKPACAQKGLEQAIERQRIRRAEQQSQRQAEENSSSPSRADG